MPVWQYLVLIILSTSLVGLIIARSLRRTPPEDVTLQGYGNRGLTVGDGVKVGIGIFIVLPLMLGAIALAGFLIFVIIQSVR